MWWPSFISVLQDLLHFALRRGAHVVTGVEVPITIPHLSSYVEPASISVITRPVTQVLHENIRYDANHTTTKNIRTYLQEELSLLTGTSDLQQVEWLLYRLHAVGKVLPWSALLVTTVGQWHETLKGKRGVEMTVTPRTAALMEWQDSVQGYIVEVTEVTPDETVTGRLFGTPLPGVATIVTYTKDQWREYRPVFITV